MTAPFLTCWSLCSARGKSPALCQPLNACSVIRSCESIHEIDWSPSRVAAFGAMSSVSKVISRETVVSSTGVEARSAVDIPVVAMPESTLLTACSVGALSAVITVGPEIGWIARGIVARHGLQQRVAGIYPLDPPVAEAAIVRAFDDPDELLASFRAAAATAVAAHADVLIPAEGILNEVCVAHGVSEVDGASVMDGVGVTFEHALMMCRLRAAGLHAGRRWTYRKPSAQTLGRLFAENGL